MRFVSRIAPEVERVRVDDVDGAVVDEVAEALFQAEQALAGGDRRGGGFAQFAIGAPVLRRVAAGAEVAHLDHVLGPRQVVAFEGARIADAVVDVSAPKWSVASGASQPISSRTAWMYSHRYSRPLSVAVPRLLTAPGRSGDQAGAEVHLEERVAHRLALLEALGEDLRVAALVGVAVAADAVAVLGADQPPGGHAVDFAGDVVQRDIDRAVSAARAAGATRSCGCCRGSARC